MTFKTRAETEAWAKSFAHGLTRPAVILLSGALGAGKTQIVRWMLEALGVPDAASPTFAIHHSYVAVSGEVDHLDLYRLESDADLEGTGFWDLLENPQALMLVEWASRLPTEVWPAAWKKVSLEIEVRGGEAREVFVSEA